MRLFRALLVLALASPAHAGVVVGDGVPFSAAELEDAIAARAGGPAGDVEVQRAGDDRLQVVHGADRWQVELGAARGAVAARLVALHVVTAPGLAPPRDEPAVVPVEDPGWFESGRVAIAGRVAGGAGDTEVTSRGIGLELSTRGRTWIGAGLEWQRGTVSSPVLAPTVVSAWRARVTVGITRGPIEVAAGPLVRRLDVDAAVGAQTWNAGAGALARVRWTLAPRWSMSAALGVDVYRHRVEVRRGDELVAGTPRAAFTAALALARDLGR